MLKQQHERYQAVRPRPIADPRPKPLPAPDAKLMAWEGEVYGASPIGGDACRY